MGKVLTCSAAGNTVKAQVEPYMSKEQAGFRKDRNTIQQILILRLIAEKAKKGIQVYCCFVDFQKAFDCIKQDVTWTIWTFLPT